MSGEFSSQGNPNNTIIEVGNANSEADKNESNANSEADTNESNVYTPNDTKKWEYVSRIDRENGSIKYTTEEISGLNYINLYEKDLQNFLLGIPVDKLLLGMVNLQKIVIKEVAAEAEKDAGVEVKRTEAKKAVAEEEEAKAAAGYATPTKEKEKDNVYLRLDAANKKAEEAIEKFNESIESLSEAKKSKYKALNELRNYIAKLKKMIKSVEDTIQPSVIMNLKRESRHRTRITRKHK